jgi:hypothetical protein
MQGAKGRTIHHSLLGIPCGLTCFFIQYGGEAIQTPLLLMGGDENGFKILNRRKLTHPYQHSRTARRHEQKIILGHRLFLNPMISLSEHLGVVEGQKRR